MSDSSYLMLYPIPSVSDSIISSLVIVLHTLLHIVIQKTIDLNMMCKTTRIKKNELPDLALQLVGGNPGSNLHQEDDSQQDGEGEGHAVALLDCTAASEESNKENYASNNDEKDRSGEESISKEVQILAVSSLDNSSSDDEEEA